MTAFPLTSKLIVNIGAVIYGRHANVQKSKAYQAFQMTSTAHDLQSTIDTAAHARKRRVMSQAFSDAALRSLEEHILKHVVAFVDSLTIELQNGVTNGWSAPNDMAQACMFDSSNGVSVPCANFSHQAVFSHSTSWLSWCSAGRSPC